MDRGMTEMHHLKVDDVVWFVGNPYGYTVQAVAGPWVVLTRPAPEWRTVLYTVLNADTKLRGRDDMHGLNYETRRGCEHAALLFTSGVVRHSIRHPPVHSAIERVMSVDDLVDLPVLELDPV